MKRLDIMDTLIKSLGKRLTKIEETHKTFSELAQNRYTNEKLVQLEIALLLSRMKEIEFVLPEKLYPNSEESRKKADIWFVTKDDIQHWIELKMRPTNYLKQNIQGKAITHGVTGVIEDYKKLQDLPNDDFKHLIFFFFPIFDESYIFFEKHLAKISRETKFKIIGSDIAVVLEEIPNGRMEGFVVSFQ